MSSAPHMSTCLKVSMQFIRLVFSVSYHISGRHPVACTDRVTDETILDMWGVGPDRPPIDTHHPAVRTHPVTGLKAWNVNEGFVTGFAELKKVELGMNDTTSVRRRHRLTCKQTSFSISQTTTSIPRTIIWCVGSGR